MDAGSCCLCARCIKIITYENTGAILGGHIIGSRATDIIAELTLAIASELTIEEISSTVHPHPTFSEAIMEAAQDTFEHEVHTISRRKNNSRQAVR